MRLQLIRHATLLVEFAGHTLLIDPMLDDVGARPPIQNSPNPRNNPLVPLAMKAEVVLTKVDAVLVTHTHSDHWDSTAEKLLPKSLPLFGQLQDAIQIPSHADLPLSGRLISHSGGMASKFHALQASTVLAK